MNTSTKNYLCGKLYSIADVPPDTIELGAVQMLNRLNALRELLIRETTILQPWSYNL